MRRGEGSNSPPSDRVPPKWPWARLLLEVVIPARLLTIALLFLAARTGPPLQTHRLFLHADGRNPAEAREEARRRFSCRLAPLDGQRWWELAERGYDSPDPPEVPPASLYPPLWPFLLSWAARAGAAPLLFGLATNSLLALLAPLLLAALALRLGATEAHARGVALALCLFPTTAWLTLFTPDAAGLVLTLSSFLLAEGRGGGRALAAAGCAFAAVLATPGAVLHASWHLGRRRAVREVRGGAWGARGAAGVAMLAAAALRLFVARPGSGEGAALLAIVTGRGPWGSDGGLLGSSLVGLPAPHLAPAAADLLVLFLLVASIGRPGPPPPRRGGGLHAATTVLVPLLAGPSLALGRLQLAGVELFWRIGAALAPGAPRRWLVVSVLVGLQAFVDTLLATWSLSVSW